MQDLATRLGHAFAEPRLLQQALTHRSRLGEAHNQRLEFLGDAVLGLLVADLLYKLYPEEPDGALARRKAALVSGPTLSRVAESFELGQHLRLGNSEEGIGRTNAANLEDACEALIGALYLDGGIDAARRFVDAHWEALAKADLTPPQDAKTALQEWSQRTGGPTPTYHVTANDGPAHAPHFTVEARLPNLPAGLGQGTSKRAAEQAAAAALLVTAKEKNA